jgi:anti-sigma B factor antagonist
MTSGAAPDRQTGGYVAPEFSVDVTHEAGVRVIAVRGELDMLTAPDFRSALDDVAKATGAVLVDLCDVTFMDSTGLTALIRGRAHLVEQGRRVAVARADDGPVARLLELTAVEAIFELHATGASALLDLRRPRR